MPQEPIDLLRTALIEFDEALSEFAPEVQVTLQPGLDDQTIGVLSALLHPLALPRDLQVLYGWHNGQYPHSPGPHIPIFHDADFLPLETAVESYTEWKKVHPIWNPLWFPAFGATGGLLVILRDNPNALTGPLWAFDREDTYLSTSYDSILGLVQTATAAWREADHLDPEFLGPDFALIRDYNSSSVRPDGMPRVTLSMFDSDTWPPDWQEAFNA